MPLVAPRAVPPFARLLLPLCLSAACLEAFADTTSAIAPTRLKSSGDLSPASPVGKANPGPTFFEADQISGHDRRDLVATGKVLMRNQRERMEADWVRYEQSTDTVEARGNVVFAREQDRIEGSALKLKLAARLGEMNDVRFTMAGGDGKAVYGGAQTLTFAGPDVYRMADASYTTCQPGDPDWELKMGDLRLDYVSSLGSARQVSVNFLNVPILYTPWMDFGLDDRRKSGFLTPKYGASDARGLELELPWYWNIAPNRDATITPRVMTKRGLQLGGEFRYLEPNYSGELDGELLPNDKAMDRDRYRLAWRHRQQFGANWSTGLEYELVSDDQYFANLSSQVNQTSQVNLPRQITAHYHGGWWQASGLLQSFQTLQDPAAPIVEPYNRLPQMTLTAARDRIFSGVDSIGIGTRFDFNGELVYFDHPVDKRVQGARLHANPSLSFPIQTAFSVFTPRLGWYLSHYALDSSTLNLSDSLDDTPETPNAPLGGFSGTTRSLPMLSLDSSLFLERQWDVLGVNYTQTLEPRAYYVYIPYRDQTRIPVFDSSSRELSLDQLFSENQFIGIDRINDANQLTLALTSRILEPGSGAERLQVTLGQRYYLSDQRVSLTGVARAAKSTELLAYASGQVTPRLKLNAGIQVDTGEGELTKASLGGGWRYGPGRLINADYRYTQGSLTQAALNQVDLSFQWPLAPKWHGLGRLNYSMEDSRLVEGLAGFEYNAGCWSLRGVMHHLATTEASATSAFYVQLELHGLTKLGPNPLDILKRSITGYVQSSEFSE
jgi:LPS-assembly protein